MVALRYTAIFSAEEQIHEAYEPAIYGQDRGEYDQRTLASLYWYPLLAPGHPALHSVVRKTGVCGPVVFTDTLQPRDPHSNV